MPVWALELPRGETVLPKGTVACISRRDAEDFRAYQQKAPEFAADLLDRATCFVPQEDMAAVVEGHEQGFTKLKLLSGHLVWVEFR